MTTTLAGIKKMYVRVDVPGDNTCLFHAVGHHAKRNGHELRQAVCSFLEQNAATQISGLTLEQWVQYEKHMNMKEYVASIRKGSWGGAIELQCLAQMLSRCIVVYVMVGSTSARKIATFGTGGLCPILFTGNHYMALTRTT
jgi:hypothetical protein